MTITLEELRKLLSMPGMTSYRQPVITPAFITESAFSVGDLAYSAVVTAGYIDKASGRFEITFDALGYTGPAPISLTIDDADIQAIREMLGIGHEMQRPFTYNELLTPRGRDDLTVAIEALEEIAQAKEGRTLFDQYMTAADIAEKCVDLAKAALTKIEIEAEADDD